MDHLVNDHRNYNDAILKYYTNSIENESYQKVTFTCKGNIHEPDFPNKLKEILKKLENILFNDNQSINVTKVEPWNSVRVTLNLSDDDAEKLRQIAEHGGETLREMGILSVQLDGQQVISLIMPNENTDAVSNVSQNNQNNVFEVENTIVDKDGHLNNSTECSADKINEHTVIDANNDNNSNSSVERSGLGSANNKNDNFDVPRDQPKLSNLFSNQISNEQTNNSGENSQTSSFYNSQQENLSETSTVSDQNKVQINISKNNEGQITSNKLIQSKPSVSYSGIRFVTQPFPPTSNTSLDSMSVQQPAKTSVPISISNFKSSPQNIFIQMHLDQPVNNRNQEIKINNDLMNNNTSNPNNNNNKNDEFHPKTTSSQQQSLCSQQITTSTATITTPTTEFVCSDIFNSINVNESLLDSVASNNDTNFDDLNELNILSVFEEIDTNQSFDTFSSTLYSDCNISNQTISSPTSSSSSLSSTTPIVNTKISSENKSAVPSTISSVVVTSTDGSPWYFINQKSQQTQSQSLPQLSSSKTVSTTTSTVKLSGQQILINNQNISTVLTEVQPQVQQSNILNQNQPTTINNNNNNNNNNNTNTNNNNNNNNNTNTNNNNNSTCTSTILSFTPINSSTIFTTPSKQAPLPSPQQLSPSRQIYIPPRTQQSWRNNANVTQHQNVTQMSPMPARKFVSSSECTISQPSLPQNKQARIIPATNYGTIIRQTNLATGNAQLNNAQIIQKLPLQQANQQILIRGPFLQQQQLQQKRASSNVTNSQNTVASSSPLLVNLLQSDVPSNSSLQTLAQPQTQFVNSAPQQIKLISSSATHNETGNRLMGLMLHMPGTSNVVSISTNKAILSNVSPQIEQTNLIQNTVNNSNNNNNNSNNNTNTDMTKPKKQRKPRKSKNQIENLPDTSNDNTANSNTLSGNFATTISNSMPSTMEISKVQAASVSTLLVNPSNQTIKMQSSTASTNLLQANPSTSSTGHQIFNQKQKVKQVVMINNSNNLDANSTTPSVSLVSSAAFYPTVSSSGVSTTTSPSKSNKIILARKSQSFPVSSAMNSRISNPTSISQTMVSSLKLIHQPQSLSNTSLSTNELRTSNVQQPTTRLTSPSKSSLSPMITTSMQTNLITSSSSLSLSSTSSTTTTSLGNNTLFVTMPPTSTVSKSNEQLIHDSTSNSTSSPLIRNSNLYKTFSIQKPGSQSSILLNQPNQVLAKMSTITLNTTSTPPSTIGIVQKLPMTIVSSNVQEITSGNISKTPIQMDVNKNNENNSSEPQSKQTEMMESNLKTQSLTEMLDGSDHSSSESVFVNCDTGQLNENSTIVSPSYFLESTYDKCDQIKSSDDSEQQSNKSLNEFEFNDFKSDTANISLPTNIATNVTKTDSSFSSNISSIVVSTSNSESNSLTESTTKAEEKAASPIKKNDKDEVFYVLKNEAQDLPDHILDDGEDEDDTDDFDIYSNTKTYLTGSIGSFHKNNSKKSTEINTPVKNDLESTNLTTFNENFQTNSTCENKKLFDSTLNDKITTMPIITATTTPITSSQSNLKTDSKVVQITDDISSQTNLPNGDILQESSNLIEENNTLSTAKNVDENNSKSLEEKPVVTTAMFQSLVASKSYPVLSINPNDVKTAVSTTETNSESLSAPRIKLLEKNKFESTPMQFTELKSQILQPSVSIQSDTTLKSDNKMTKGRRKTSDTPIKMPPFSSSSTTDSNLSQSTDSKSLISIDANDKLYLLKNHSIPIISQTDSTSSTSTLMSASPNSKLRLVCIPSNSLYMVKPLQNSINSGATSFKVINKSVAGQSSTQSLYLPLGNSNQSKLLKPGIFSTANVKFITGNQNQQQTNVTKTESGDFSTKKVNVLTNLPEKETIYSSTINLNVRSQEISDSEKTNAESQKSSTETIKTETETSANVTTNVSHDNPIDNVTQETIKCTTDFLNKKPIEEASNVKVSNEIIVESTTTAIDKGSESKLNSSKNEVQNTIVKPKENQPNVNVSTLQTRKVISNENVVFFKTTDNLRDKEKLEQLSDTGIRGQFLITKAIPKSFYNSRQILPESSSSQIFATKSNNATITATKTVPSILRQSKRKNDPTYQTITLGPQPIVKSRNNETESNSFEMLSLDPNVVSFTPQKYSSMPLKESDELSDTSKPKKRARKSKVESVNILPSTTTTSYSDYEMNVLETMPVSNKTTGENIKLLETPASNVRILRNSTAVLPKANVKRTPRNNRVLLSAQSTLVPGTSVQSVTLNQNESISSEEKKVLTVMGTNNRQTRSNRSRKKTSTSSTIIQTESELSEQSSAINIPSGSELETNINPTQLITGTIDTSTNISSFLSQTPITVSDELFSMLENVQNEHENSGNANVTDASNNLMKCRTRKVPITNAKSSLRNTTVTDTPSAKRRRIKEVTK